MSREEQSDEVLLVIRITEQLANTLPHFSPHYCLSLHTLLYCRQLCASQFLAAFHLSPCREENTWDLRRRNVTISVKVWWCPAVSGRASVVASGSGPPPPLIGNKRSDSRAWHKVKLGNWNLVYFDVYQSIHYSIALQSITLHYYIILLYYITLH